LGQLLISSGKPTPAGPFKQGPAPKSVKHATKDRYLPSTKVGEIGIPSKRNHVVRGPEKGPQAILTSVSNKTRGCRHHNTARRGGKKRGGVGVPKGQLLPTGERPPHHRWKRGEDRMTGRMPMRSEDRYHPSGKKSA